MSAEPIIDNQPNRKSKSFSMRPQRFSRLHLIIFACAFALLGAILVTRSFAATVTSIYSSAVNNSTSKSLVIPKPVGLAAGDVMIAQVSARYNDPIISPTGWKLVRDTPFGNAGRMTTFWKSATDNEASSYAFSTNYSSGKAGGIAAWRGIDPVNPIDASSSKTGTGNSVTASGVTTSNANAPVLFLAGQIGPYSYTPPSGLTEHWDVKNTAGSYKTNAIEADYIKTSAGSTGNKTAVSSGAGGGWMAQLVALRPKVATTAPTPLVTLSASPESIDSGGSSTLKWSSTNATSCKAPWTSLVSTSGSASTGVLSATTKYSISCTGEGGTTSASTQVNVASSPPPIPQPSPGSTGEMFITRTELMSKPTNGAGWTHLYSRAELPSYGLVTLADQNSFTQSNVLAGALVYARTGDIKFKDKVIDSIKQVCGTETSTGSRVLSVGRTLYGYVVAADLVQMPYSTTCNNGQTWQAFLEAIRTKTLPGNSRWPTLEITAADTASNWGAYALPTHLAVSYALNDKVAIENDIKIFKRYLGDTSITFKQKKTDGTVIDATGFLPTEGYRYPTPSLTSSSNGLAWDLSDNFPTITILQRGINPSKVTVPGLNDPNNLDGAIIEDTLRNGSTSPSVPCCTVTSSGTGYHEEALDGIISTAQLLRAHGIDTAPLQDKAMKRAYDFYLLNAGTSFDKYPQTRFMAYAMNYWYGTSYPLLEEVKPYRHMGFGSWLFSK